MYFFNVLHVYLCTDNYERNIIRDALADFTNQIGGFHFVEYASHPRFYYVYVIKDGG